jgi:ABC-type glycerol-3-phosphate transport system permease component
MCESSRVAGWCPCLLSPHLIEVISRFPNQWHDYWDAIKYGAAKVGDIPFLRYALNTIDLAVLGVTGCVLSNSLVAYGFSRIKWRGRDVVFALTWRR